MKSFLVNRHRDQLSITLGCICSALLGLYVLSKCLYYSHSGLDFTDEGFYLNWIKDPWLYPASVTQFGFVYHPLFQLTHGNVGVLRIINIGTVFILGLWLTYLLLFNSELKHLWSRMNMFLLSFGAAAVGLNIFKTWLATPNYNSLTLKGLLITAIGLFFTQDATTTRRAKLGDLLIAVGGCVTFLAKPSSAALLALLASMYLILTKKFTVRRITLQATASIMMLSFFALLVDGSVTTFAERIGGGVTAAKMLKGGHDLLSIVRLGPIPADLSKNLYQVGTVLAGLLGVLYFLKSKGLIITILATLFSFVYLIGMNGTTLELTLDDFSGAIITFTPLVVTSLFFSIRPVSTIITKKNAYLFATFLYVTPYIYAFGTNGNYWAQSSFSALFWLIAAVTLSGTAQARKKYFQSTIVVSILAAQIIATISLQRGLDSPYRQATSLRDAQNSISLGPGKHRLLIDEASSNWINKARSAAAEAGFVAGTPIIDLTGKSPTILFALNAKAIGSPWLLGGYKGSAQLALHSLSTVAQTDLNTAWILTEPNGPRALPTSLLAKLNLNFPRKYAVVGEWSTAKELAGYRRRLKQVLYKPLD